MRIAAFAERSGELIGGIVFGCEFFHLSVGHVVDVFCQIAHAVATVAHTQVSSAFSQTDASSGRSQAWADRPDRASARVIENAKILSAALSKRGYKIFTGGTDCHLLLVDLRPQKLTGKLAEYSLEKAGLTCNKNSIPFDTEKPTITSGIRLGTPAATTRGFRAKEFDIVANLIADVLDGLKDNPQNNNTIEQEVLRKVQALCKDFPIY